jgi:hypothetical protein
MELVREKDVVACFLHFQMLDKDSANVGTGPGPPCLATKNAIMFCPWCGADLRRFYRNAELPEWKVEFSE